MAERPAGRRPTQFLTILKDVTKEANGAVAKKEAANRENILKAGGTIRELTPEQRKTWVDTMKPVWDQVRRRHRQGPDRRRRSPATTDRTANPALRRYGFYGPYRNHADMDWRVGKC
jgi:hypothetical protein